MTRLIVLLLAVILAVTFVNAVDHDGEPGCKDAQEPIIRVFRNNWDPSKYWVCHAINTRATLEPCLKETFFLTSAGKCVPLEEWQWVKPVEPITRP